MTEVQLGYKLNDFLFSADFKNSAKTDEDVLSNAVSLEVVDMNNSSIENNEIGKIKLFFDDDNSKIPTYYKWTKVNKTEGKWEVASSYKPKIENGVISFEVTEPDKIEHSSCSDMVEKSKPIDTARSSFVTMFLGLV